MQVPVQIDFQAVEAGDHLRQHIHNRLDDLEDRFGRITSAHIAVKGPGRRHRTGGHYAVRIHLALPEGRHVDVDRTPDADERQGDLLFAIDDAFNRARRQLQDRARRMAGAVKVHEDAPIATVARLDPSGEYGFLSDRNGDEIYFHRNSLVNARMRDLSIGTRVSFAETMGNEGAQASTVRLLGKHKMRT